MYLAIACVKGFSYEPLIIKPQYSEPFYCDVSTKETVNVSRGYINGDLAEGRPQKWGDARLYDLVITVAELKKSYQLSTDREALNMLARRKEYLKLGLKISKDVFKRVNCSKNKN